MVRFLFYRSRFSREGWSQEAPFHKKNALADLPSIIDGRRIWATLAPRSINVIAKQKDTFCLISSCQQLKKEDKQRDFSSSI